MATNGNANWSFQLPELATANFLNPGQGGLPTGYYPVKIASSLFIQPDTSKPGGVEYTCTVVEQGEFFGREVRVTVWIPAADSKPGVKGHWKNLMDTVGQGAYNGQAMTIGPTTFTGKVVYVYAQAPAEGEKTADGKDKYTNYTFVTKQMFEKGRAAQAATATAAPAAGGAPSMAFGGTPPPANPGIAAPASAPAGFGGVPQPPGVMGQLGQQFGQPSAAPGFAQPQAGFAQPQQQQQQQQQQQGFGGVPQPVQAAPF